MRKNKYTVNAFYEIDSHDFTQQLEQKIKVEIEGRSKEYILGVDENEFKEYLISKYTLEPLIISPENEPLSSPIATKEWIEDRFWGRREVELYVFTVKYKFSGSAELFSIKPSRWQMTTNKITVNEEQGTVSYNFKISDTNVVEFNRRNEESKRSAFANLENVNDFAKNWNNGLSEKVNSFFQSQKLKYQKENDFFAAINVKVNQDTASVFTAPTVKKKIIPQPTVSPTKEFASEPTMSREMYDDVLKVIYDSGKNMEKKPVLYQGRDEEGLRDQLLFVLETRYEGTTATGETFNRSGKTDILLKYANDGSNLFVAECKFWHGAAEFSKAISQLFDRYLTWRDSKVAVIMFVTNKDFSNVIEAIKSEAVKHPYFVKEVGERGESSFSYIFRLPQDEKKPVNLEVMAFHYDK
jgi:hypothetical protein